MNIYFFYKISHSTLPHCYIGKTRNPRDRLATHRSKTKTCNYNLYKTIRDNGGWEGGHWKFDILETSELDNISAMEREQELYKEHKANLNMCKPDGNRSAYSYYQRNKETMRVIARNKYKKQKTEWLNPKMGSEKLKKIALNKVEKLGHLPTDFTMEKHKITAQEVQERLKIFEKSQADNSA